MMKRNWKHEAYKHKIQQAEKYSCLKKEKP